MNHVRTVIRSCGLCLIKVFIDDLWARAHACACVYLCVYVGSWGRWGTGKNMERQENRLWAGPREGRMKRGRSQDSERLAG